MRKTEDPHTCSETKNKIPMQYIILMGQLIYLLQWIVNSTSWEEGVLQEFDRHEVNLKVKSFGL
jgi:hypothetical protein